MSDTETRASDLDPNLSLPPPVKVRMAEKIRQFLSVPAYGVDPLPPPPEVQRLLNLQRHMAARDEYYINAHRRMMKWQIDNFARPTS